MTEQYRIDRRTAITDAASRCFIRNGVHRTSMADIIAESGLSAGAIYNHFRSKEEITVSVAASLVRGRLLHAIDQLREQGIEPSPARMVEIALTTVRDATVGDDMPMSVLIMQFWAEAAVNPAMLPPMQEQMTSIKQSFTEPIKHWAQHEHGLSARRAGRWAGEIGQLLISFVIGFVIQRNIFPGFDEDSYLRTAVATADGIRPPA